MPIKANATFDKDKRWWMLYKNRHNTQRGIIMHITIKIDLYYCKNISLKGISH